MSKFPVFKCPKCGVEVLTINGKDDRVFCPDCGGDRSNKVRMEFDHEQPYTFLDLLRSGTELNCDLIIGDCDMPASFVWYEGCNITAYGIEKFEELMESEFTELENGNIEIHCDDERLGEQFCIAAAGYISENEYNRIFGQED